MHNQQPALSFTGHKIAFYVSHPGNVYEYDSAEDGPEVDVITRIRAAHAFYTLGGERELLKFQRFVDNVSRTLYNERYERLGKKRQARVRKVVVFLRPWFETNFDPNNSV